MATTTRLSCKEMVARIESMIEESSFELVMRERGTGTEHIMRVDVECDSLEPDQYRYTIDIDGFEEEGEDFGNVTTLYKLTRTNDAGTVVTLEFVRFV